MLLWQTVHIVDNEVLKLNTDKKQNVNHDR
jgi:hypothetical protein